MNELKTSIIHYTDANGNKLFQTHYGAEHLTVPCADSVLTTRGTVYLSIDNIEHH